MVDELTVSNSNLQKAYNLTYCHFSGISEQTVSGLKEAQKIFGEENNVLPTLDMRCIWKDS
jgi:hypothetical protein